MLTPPRRQALYGSIASLSAVAIAFGLITDMQAETILSGAAHVLAFASLLLARTKVPEAPDAG